MGSKKRAGGTGEGGRRRHLRPRTPPTFNTLLADGAGAHEPEHVITQRELEAYRAELHELRTLLGRHAKRREALAVRVWDGAAVEDGPLTAGLMPTGDGGQQVRFGAAAHAIESGAIDSSHRKPGGKRVRLVVGAREREASAIRDHGVSEEHPKGRMPLPAFYFVVNDV